MLDLRATVSLPHYEQLTISLPVGCTHIPYIPIILFSFLFTSMNQESWMSVDAMLASTLLLYP